MRVTEHRRRLLGAAAANHALGNGVTCRVYRIHGRGVAADIPAPQFVIHQIKTHSRMALDHVLGSTAMPCGASSRVLGPCSSRIGPSSSFAFFFKVTTAWSSSTVSNNC